MLLWGTFGYLAALAPPALGHEVGRRLAALRIAATLLTVTSAVLLLPVETATIADGWPAAVSVEALRAVLFETSLGWAWAARCLAAAALALAAALPRRMRMAGTALAAGVQVAMLALQGHAAMQEGWTGVAHRLNDAVHVLAGGAWLGALVPLVPILAALDRPDACRQASIALRRFSSAGHGAVALVIATGIINTALILGRWPTDWSSTYQIMLAVKIGVVSVMTALAVLNRYLLVPRLRSRRDIILRALRRATLAEVALGLTAVALVAVFGLLEPLSLPSG